MLPVIGELRPWADPTITAIGRLPARPPTVAHPDADSARRGERSESPWWRSLDGRWRFRWFPHVDTVPPAAVRAPDAVVGPTDLDGWSTAAVPGVWTMQPAGRRAGDLPQYTNIQMPFDGPPPQIPDEIPTGVYQRRFTVPRRWRGRRVIVHIGGADSVHAVYVNGHFAGYGTDSRLASEYDVTDHVHAGQNQLAIVVMRWSAHSYLEDQDQWWMAGLHREVALEARAPTGLSSVVCDASYEPDAGLGRMIVTATVGGTTPPPAGYQVRVRLATAGGRALGPARTAAVPHRFDQPYLFTGHDAILRFEIPGVRPWSAEDPVRYRVIVELIDPEGSVVEAHGVWIGFRTVKIRSGQLCINGRPIRVFGMNRHDHHPDRGPAVTVADLRADLEAMKALNVNALRCAHYPNDPRLLDLCDELGLYVIDEANIEAHAYNTSLCRDDRFAAAWMDRGQRMVRRDRNHPCVVMWSLGNESGYGPHHDALAAWIRRVDPSRPLHYEGAVFEQGWSNGGRAVTDVVCPMYPELDAVRAYEGDRPLVMCEYSHAMGNSNGGLAEIWEVIEESVHRGGPLQGGFLWEWKDHGLRAELPSGVTGFAYGGQFGETRHDGNFVADGVMAADLRPHPAVQELAWVYRPVMVTAVGRSGVSVRGLRIRNRRSFTSAADLRLRWELIADGVPVASATMDPTQFDPAQLGPGDEHEVPLPDAVRDALDDRRRVDPAAEVHLNLQWTQRRATAWAPAGHQVAGDQIQLRRSRRRPTDRRRLAEVELGDPRPLMDSEVSLCLLRAPVDNDGFRLLPELRELGIGGRSVDRWRRLGLFDRPAEDLVDHRHRVQRLDGGAELHDHEVVVADHLADLPRVGVRFTLRAGFDQMHWFGRGPAENYPDRCAGAFVGVYESALDELPYLVPQEFGGRTGCRWFEVRRSRPGRGPVGLRMMAISPAALQCSATRSTVEELIDAVHATELVPRRGPVVHLDLAHRGLGTASCGPDVAAEHRIAPGTYRFSYVLGSIAGS